MWTKCNFIFCLNYRLVWKKPYLLCWVWHVPLCVHTSELIIDNSEKLSKVVISKLLVFPSRVLKTCFCYAIFLSLIAAMDSCIQTDEQSWQVNLVFICPPYFSCWKKWLSYYVTPCILEETCIAGSKILNLFTDCWNPEEKATVKQLKRNWRKFAIKRTVKSEDRKEN